jgi:hypothetical protein
MAGAAAGGAGLGVAQSVANKRKRQSANTQSSSPSTGVASRTNTLFGKSTDITPKRSVGQRIKSLFG